MAKIIFISVNDVNAEGLRIMSSLLRQNKHQSYIIFLQRNCFPYNLFDKRYFYSSKKVKEHDWVGIDAKGTPFAYSSAPAITDNDTKLLFSLIEDIKPNIICFSVTTPFKKRAGMLSRLIKDRYDIPVIWGGPEPTVNPQDCLNYCDYVCIGEGEKTITDIAEQIDNNDDIGKVNNLAYRNNNRLMCNKISPLIGNLDALPFKDISWDNKFLIDDGVLVTDFGEISYSRNHAYHLISSRGCPYNCSYCCENNYKKLYSTGNFFRRRSPANVIKELKKAKETIGFKIVQFEDEIFSVDYNWLKEFRDQYKKEIGLPFISYIFADKEINRNLALLKEAGLQGTVLALQSGSARINQDVFNRPFDKGSYLGTAYKLKTMKINFHVDIITFNPFEKEDDLRDTLNVLLQLPKPFEIDINKLHIIKGTTLYELVNNCNGGQTMALLPERVFCYYAYLFLLTRQLNKHIIHFIQKIGIFKNLPFLLRVVLILRFNYYAILKTFYSLSTKLKKRSKIYSALVTLAKGKITYQQILSAIERKRNARNYFWKALVLGKDMAWGCLTFYKVIFFTPNSTFINKLFFRLYPLAKQGIIKGAVQKEKELEALIALLKGRPLNSVLEIGTNKGGTFYVWSKLAEENAKIISLCLGGRKFLCYKKAKQKLSFLKEDSHQEMTKKTVENILAADKLDLLFIDGDHSYSGVKKDFTMYTPLVKEGGVIALHDICFHTYDPTVDVYKFWQEIKNGYKYFEYTDKADETWGGIGVLIK